MLKKKQFSIKSELHTEQVAKRHSISFNSQIHWIVWIYNIIKLMFIMKLGKFNKQ
jgi:hypothetical protein